MRGNDKRSLKKNAHKNGGLALAALTTLILGATIVAVNRIPTARAGQSTTMENTKMWPYKALAELAYASFEKGENAKAAEVAHILERVWDKSEDYGGDTALSKTNPDLFKDIDAAMDGFINPIMNYAKKAPDKARVKAAYTEYLAKLKQAD
jgi:hypothetical protein